MEAQKAVEVDARENISFPEAQSRVRLLSSTQLRQPTAPKAWSLPPPSHEALRNELVQLTEEVRRIKEIQVPAALR